MQRWPQSRDSDRRVDRCGRTLDRSDNEFLPRTYPTDPRTSVLGLLLGSLGSREYMAHGTIAKQHSPVLGPTGNDSDEREFPLREPQWDYRVSGGKYTRCRSGQT